MVDWPTYPTDAAICRLLAGEPLPTAAIADRLATPVRTVRHRLLQLRRNGVVVVGPDGLHHLAAPAAPDLAAPAAPDLAAAIPDRTASAQDLAAAAGAGDRSASGEPTGENGRHPTVVAVLAAVGVGLAVVGIGLAAVAAVRLGWPDPPPAPPSPYGYAGGWYPGPA